MYASKITEAIPMEKEEKNNSSKPSLSSKALNIKCRASKTNIFAINVELNIKASPFERHRIMYIKAGKKVFF
jgi:hypothetical protein